MKALKLTFLLLMLPALLKADFGLQQELENSAALSLKSNNAAYSIAFPVPQSMDLLSVGLYCSQSQGAPSIKLELFEDQGGTPAKKALASSTLVPASSAWAVFHYAGVRLVQGKRYHLVLSGDPLRGGNHPIESLSGSKFVSFLATGGQTHPDYKLLNLQGKTWKTLALAPVFVLHGDKGQLLGNPYTHGGAVSIHGNGTPDNLDDDTWHAQALHFKCGTTADKIRVRVRKVGKPEHPLMLEIQKHDYAKHQVTPLLSSTALQPQTVSEEWSWQTIQFSQSAPFPLSPECHYFAFHSAAGSADEKLGCQDCWQISYAQAAAGIQGAADLTFDGGAHRSRAAHSIKAKHWFDTFERDLNVVVETPDCAPSSQAGALPLPTPEYRP